MTNDTNDTTTVETAEETRQRWLDEARARAIEHVEGRPGPRYLRELVEHAEIVLGVQREGHIVTLEMWTDLAYHVGRLDAHLAAADGAHWLLLVISKDPVIFLQTAHVRVPPLRFTLREFVAIARYQQHDDEPEAED